MEPKRVLVVEDDKDAIAIASTVLSHAGFVVIVVEDGAHACEAVVIHKPDIILLDLRLPNEDGEQIATNLHGDPRCSHIPIVVLTADVARRNAAFPPNVRKVVLKPVAPRVVVAMVQAALCPS